jgi:N-acetylglutamate synthase-like GNAT family acetyltransferase
MANSKSTGISNITGKTVYIRHATEWDMVILGERLTRRQKEAVTLEESAIVVAAEEERIIGFGVLEKAREGVGCLMVTVSSRGREIKPFIVRHLLEYAPMKTIYAASDRPGYFKRLGFTKMKAISQKQTDFSDPLCRLAKSGSSLVKYEKQ